MAALVIVLVLLCAWAPLSSTRWTLVEETRSEVLSTASASDIPTAENRMDLDTLASSSDIVDGISTKENIMTNLPFDVDAIPVKKNRANLAKLPSEVINGIKKFVFFVGYACARSGHSIVGSLMDAHPHVVIAHEFSAGETTYFRPCTRKAQEELGLVLPKATH